MARKGGKHHLKRLAAPITYKIPRKENRFTFAGSSGTHSYRNGIPLGIIIREIWGYAQNMKELRYILNSEQIFVDFVPRKDPRFIVGTMDVISIPTINKNYRLVPWPGRRQLSIQEIDEEHAEFKLVMIKSKTTVKNGNIQLNCTAGVNILLKKSDNGKYTNKWDDPATYFTKGTIKYHLKEHKVMDFYPLNEGSPALIVSGVNTGKWGTLQAFEKRIGKNRSQAVIKAPDGSMIVTALENIFIIGSEKPELASILKMDANTMTA